MPEPNEVSDTKWVSKSDLIQFFLDPSTFPPFPPFPSIQLTRRPGSEFTPWFKLIAETFLYKWWDLLLASRTAPGALLDAKSLIPHVAGEQAVMGEIMRM